MLQSQCSHTSGFDNMVSLHKVCHLALSHASAVPSRANFNPDHVGKAIAMKDALRWHDDSDWCPNYQLNQSNISATGNFPRCAMENPMHFSSAAHPFPAVFVEHRIHFGIYCTLPRFQLRPRQQAIERSTITYGFTFERLADTNKEVLPVHLRI